MLRFHFWLYFKSTFLWKTIVHLCLDCLQFVVSSFIYLSFNLAFVPYIILLISPLLFYFLLFTSHFSSWNFSLSESCFLFQFTWFFPHLCIHTSITTQKTLQTYNIFRDALPKQRTVQNWRWDVIPDRGNVKVRNFFPIPERHIHETTVTHMNHYTYMHTHTVWL